MEGEIILMTPFTLNTDKVQFLMIDIQEKLLPAINDHDKVLRNSIKLARAATTLNVPLKYTEQYPRGLGGTAEELLKVLPPDSERFEKTHFSCMAEPGFELFLNDQIREQVVVFGIESHICVFSTVMAMLEKKIKVIVAVDACGSRVCQNHTYAMDTMGRYGAMIIPSESVIYQLICRAGTPQFKELLPLFKETE